MLTEDERPRDEGPQPEGERTTLRMRLELVMDKFAEEGGTLFPWVMLLWFCAVALWASQLTEDELRAHWMVLVIYSFGGVGVVLKFLAVFKRTFYFKNMRKPTLLSLGFTYERLALALIIVNILLMAIDRRIDIIPFDVPPWFTTAMLSASFIALFMVGFLEWFGRGKRKWLGWHVEPWPWPLRPLINKCRRKKGFDTKDNCKVDEGGEDE